MGEYDEYGCEIPEEHKPWMAKATEWLWEDSEDDNFLTTGIKGLLTPFFAFGGAVMDETPILGGPLAGPFNEIAHGIRGQADQERYQQCRADAKAAEAAEAANRPDVPSNDPEQQQFTDGSGNPVSYDRGDTPAYDPEQGSYVDEGGNPVSYEEQPVAPYEGY